MRATPHSLFWRSGSQGARRGGESPWRRARKAMLSVVGVVSTIGGVATLIVAAWVVVCFSVLMHHRHQLDIDTIGVPETLSKAGFTSEVATFRLRDAILDVQHAGTTEVDPGFGTDRLVGARAVPSC
jgi:hypothetical protein